MNKYHQLTLLERERIYGFLKEKHSLRYIARILHRSHGSISRELKRNRKYGIEYLGNSYIPCKAQQLADKRSQRQHRKAPLKNPAVFVFVREHLRMGWSPEMIAGRIKIEVPKFSICPETIYQYIYAKRFKTRGLHLEQYLTLQRKKRMRKLGRSVHRRGRIFKAVSIDKRPKSVISRKQVGHWETDNVLGKQTDQTALSVSVERKTRYTIITKLTNRTAKIKADQFVNRLSKFPKRSKRSVTADNGLENAEHLTITRKTGMPVYFCHAYHSWEKGTVENTNGRIRRYIPKGLSIDQISRKYIQTIEDTLNSTPRKCLNFLTPREMMAKLQIAT
jgi:transposase, IS30 family